jgi:branched-chain amino acid transport system permease protein
MLPEALRAFDQVRMFAFGIGLIVLMLLRPQGLWPSRIGQIERRAVIASASSVAAGVGADTAATIE